MCYNTDTWILERIKFVADVKRKGFKTLETDYEELEEQIRDHRKHILKRALQVLVVLAVLIIGVELVYALRSFDDYEVRDAMDRSSSGSAKYEMFGECLLEYSNDGIACIGKNNDIIWN